MRRAICLASIVWFIPAIAPAQTRMLRSPTVSATQIAFAYANDIWVVSRAGGSAQRLTSFQGQTSSPHFSPDGRFIAFSAEYAGNTDVYVMPAAGGEPRRLTWHPAPDLVQGWTPDGKSIVFSSTRSSNLPSPEPRWFTVPVEGGPSVGDADVSRVSGKDLARRRAHRLPDEQLVGRRATQLSWWPESSDLDLDSKTLDVDTIPRPNSKEMYPVWYGNQRCTSCPTAMVCRTSGRTTWSRSRSNRSRTFPTST